MQNANVGSYKAEGFVEVLAASQTPRSTEWFQGTADAVRQYIWLFEEAVRNGVEDLLILSGKPHTRILSAVVSVYYLIPTNNNRSIRLASLWYH